MKGALESGVFDTPLRILAVKRQAQPAVGVLLRKGLLFGDRSPFLYTRAPLPGTGAEPEGPTSRGPVGEPYGTDATRKPDVSDFPYRRRRDTRYTSTMESIGRRPTLTRRRPWRSGTVAPSGPVRPAAGSGRRAVPSDSGPGRGVRAGVCLRIPPVV